MHVCMHEVRHIGACRHWGEGPLFPSTLHHSTMNNLSFSLPPHPAIPFICHFSDRLSVALRVRSTRCHRRKFTGRIVGVSRISTFHDSSRHKKTLVSRTDRFILISSLSTYIYVLSVPSDFTAWISSKMEAQMELMKISFPPQKQNNNVVGYCRDFTSDPYQIINFERNSPFFFSFLSLDFGLFLFPYIRLIVSV